MTAASLPFRPDFLWGCYLEPHSVYRCLVPALTLTNFSATDRASENTTQNPVNKLPVSSPGQTSPTGQTYQTQWSSPVNGPQLISQQSALFLLSTAYEISRSSLTFLSAFSMTSFLMSLQPSSRFSLLARTAISLIYSSLMVVE